MARIVHERRREAEGDDDEDELEEGEDGWKPKLRSQEGHTPELSTLYSIVEAIQETTRTLVAVNGGKPPKAQKIPRPFSALDMLDLEDERDEMADMARRFGVGGKR